MSEYWGLRCETCNVATELEFNHGRDWLQEIVQSWNKIKPVYEMTASPTLWHVQLSLMNEYGDLKVFDFLNAHATHKIVLHSEYGTKIDVVPKLD